MRAENSPSMSLTLAVIKPDAFSRASSIEARLRAANFAVLARATITLLPSQVAELYEDVEGTPAYSKLLKLMTSGPVVALALEKSDAVAALSALMGPEDSGVAKSEAPQSLRAEYGTDAVKNAVHGSATPVAAFRELRLFFPRVHPPRPPPADGMPPSHTPPLPSLPRARRLTRALVPTASRRSLRLRRRWRS